MPRLEAQESLILPSQPVILVQKAFGLKGGCQSLRDVSFHQPSRNRARNRDLSLSIGSYELKDDRIWAIRPNKRSDGASRPVKFVNYATCPNKGRKPRLRSQTSRAVRQDTQTPAGDGGMPRKCSKRKSAPPPSASNLSHSSPSSRSTPQSFPCATPFTEPSGLSREAHFYVDFCE